MKLKFQRFLKSMKLCKPFSIIITNLVHQIPGEDLRAYWLFKAIENSIQTDELWHIGHQKGLYT